MVTHESEVAPQDLYMRALDPDTILPAQYQHGGSRALSGEKRLMLAVLLDAVHVYSRHVAPWEHEKRRLFVETRRWFDSHDRRWPFAFECICDTLDLDCERLRRTLRARRRALATRSEPTIEIRSTMAELAPAALDAGR